MIYEARNAFRTHTGLAGNLLIATKRQEDYSKLQLN